MARLAFEVCGNSIRRVAPLYRIHRDTPQTWWVPDGAEISMTPLGNGMRIELTRDLLDGCERSVQRVSSFFSEFLGTSATDFSRLYFSLMGMEQPQPEG